MFRWQRAGSNARNNPRDALAATPYQFVRELGSGAYSEVLLARRTGGRELVAVKVLDRPQKDPGGRMRFLQEQQLMLDHPNLLRHLDWLQDSRRALLVMEFAEGGDLQTWLNQRDRIAAETAEDVARQLLAGLTLLHERRILHRDLKPTNILLARGSSPVHPRVVISDFGVALDSAREDFGTMRPGPLGTVGYLAPEVWEDGASEASDLYSLGLVLAEVHRKSGEQSESLTSLIEQLTRIDPAERPSSARRASDQLPMATNQPDWASDDLPEWYSPDKSRRPAVVGTLIATVVAGVAGLMVVTALTAHDDPLPLVAANDLAISLIDPRTGTETARTARFGTSAAMWNDDEVLTVDQADLDGSDQRLVSRDRRTLRRRWELQVDECDTDPRMIGDTDQSTRPVFILCAQRDGGIDIQVIDPSARQVLARRSIDGARLSPDISESSVQRSFVAADRLYLPLARRGSEFAWDVAAVSAPNWRVRKAEQPLARGSTSLFITDVGGTPWLTTRSAAWSIDPTTLAPEASVAIASNDSFGSESTGPAVVDSTLLMLSRPIDGDPTIVEVDTESHHVRRRSLGSSVHLLGTPFAQDGDTAITLGEDNEGLAVVRIDLRTREVRVARVDLVDEPSSRGSISASVQGSGRFTTVQVGQSGRTVILDGVTPLTELTLAPVPGRAAVGPDGRAVVLSDVGRRITLVGADGRSQGRAELLDRGRGVVIGADMVAVLPDPPSAFGGDSLLAGVDAVPSDSVEVFGTEFGALGPGQRLDLPGVTDVVTDSVSGDIWAVAANSLEKLELDPETGKPRVARSIPVFEAEFSQRRDRAVRVKGSVAWLPAGDVQATLESIGQIDAAAAQPLETVCPPGWCVVAVDLGTGTRTGMALPAPVSEVHPIGDGREALAATSSAMLRLASDGSVTEVLPMSEQALGFDALDAHRYAVCDRTGTLTVIEGDRNVGTFEVTSSDSIVQVIAGDDAYLTVDVISGELASIGEDGRPRTRPRKLDSSAVLANGSGDRDTAAVLTGRGELLRVQIASGEILSATEVFDMPMRGTRD